jgi:zinc transporter
MRLIREPKNLKERVDGDSDPEWVDLDLDAPGVASWLESHLELGEDTRGLLLNNERRNRRFVIPEGLFLSLCYPSGAKEEEVEEAVFRVGVLVTPGRILTVRRGRVPSVEDLFEAIQNQTESLDSVWEVLTELVERIAICIELVLDHAAEGIDALEDRVFEDAAHPPIDEVGQLRRQLILDRRHITSMKRVVEESIDDRRFCPDAKEAQDLRTAAEAVIRQERTVEFFLERANLIQDQIQSLLSDRMNTATLRLGVVATVFLPLSFLTGLLGINVAGMPGSHNPVAFWVVCAILTVLALGAWIVVGRLHRQEFDTTREESKD